MKWSNFMKYAAVIPLSILMVPTGIQFLNSLILIAYETNLLSINGIATSVYYCIIVSFFLLLEALPIYLIATEKSLTGNIVKRFTER